MMQAGSAGSMTAGGALLARLKAIGVDYIFANLGTDFPPIIEGLAEAAAIGIDLPQALVIPHEHAAMGMAHGYYLATGRAQAVMAWPVGDGLVWGARCLAVNVLRSGDSVFVDHHGANLKSTLNMRPCIRCGAES